MTRWMPRIAQGDAPLYERLVGALEADVRAGRLSPGDRMPPHRDLAHSLSVSVGTVSRAYAEAERRGLLTSHVGRGSFITDRGTVPARQEAAGPLDLAHNIPPLEPAERWIEETLARVRRRADLTAAMAYSPPEGLEVIRRAGAEWLARRHRMTRARTGTIIQCNGGQHGMTLAFSAVARPGDPILCEAATYPGIRTLADHFGYRLTGVAMDARGIEPEALARAARETGARLLVLIPNLQNPTTITLDATRRAEIVAVARALDLVIVEDDAYRVFTDPDCPPCFADLAPERTFLIASVSKSLSPGLRLAFLVPPSGTEPPERLILAIRALGYSPPVLGGLVFSQWVADGTADRIADDIIGEIGARTALARTILGDAMAPPGAARSLHVWLPMAPLDAERLASRALRAGTRVTPPDGPIILPSPVSGVRLCLGGIRSRALVEQALLQVHAALRPDRGSEARSLV